MELFQRIETLIGKKLPAFPTQEEEVMMLVERVSEAQRFARLVSNIYHVITFLSSFIHSFIHLFIYLFELVIFHLAGENGPGW